MQKVKRVLFVTYMIALHLALLYFAGDALLRKYTWSLPIKDESVDNLMPSTPVPTPLPVPETFADPVNTNTSTNTTDDNTIQTAPVSGQGFVIPILGVRPDQLVDTFSDSRSENRYHDAIDIAAPQGTPVIAAADGEIVKFLDSDRGGITIYQLTDDKRFVLYYAHLQRRADEISVGMRVKKGATIGFVGDTGNAGAGNFHLHFSVAIITDPKRFWSGTYINPYPLLKNGEYPG